ASPRAASRLPGFREAREIVRGHAHQLPLGHELRAERLVEADRGLVPVEHAPLQAPAAAFDRELREASEQRLADAVPALGRLDEEILEIEAGLAEERRESREEEREADRASVARRDERFARAARAEEGLVQQRLGPRRHVLELFVHGELADEAQDLPRVL